MNAVMIIIVAACGSMGSGGSGCGVSVHHVEFGTMALCEAARAELFPATSEEWQPKREIKCVKRINHF